MTALITQRDEAAVATGNGYRYDRVVEFAGRIMRARIDRQFCVSYGLAFVDMVNDAKSWIRVVEDLACPWWDATPAPRARMSTPPPCSFRSPTSSCAAPPGSSPRPRCPDHVLDAVSALLATYPLRRRSGASRATRRRVRADPETVCTAACGRLVLGATDPFAYADAVTDLLDVWADEDLGHGYHPRDGWPWPDSHDADWVFTFHHGRVRITTGRAWLPAGTPVER
jgi:hypothetical protein